MSKVFIVLVILASFLIGCSQNAMKETETTKHTEEKQAVNMNQNPTPANNPSTNNPHQAMKKRIVVPEEVKNRYKTVDFLVEDKTDKNSKPEPFSVDIGKKAKVANTSLEVEVELLLPDFVMDETGLMTTKSADLKNPAVKVKIFKNGNLVFDGWLFKNFPDIHPFSDEKYKILFVNAK